VLRAEVAGLLEGHGIEIGPLHHPFPVPPTVDVTYVDRLDHDGLLAHYAGDENVPANKITVPEIVADATTLDAIDDASFDFVISSHVIEHLSNPIEALVNWRRVLREGGVLVCVVPDSRYTFDKGRPVTSYEHLCWDYCNSTSESKRLSDMFHIAEGLFVAGATASVEVAVETGRNAVDTSPDVHYHVWDYASFGDHLSRLTAAGLAFEVVHQGCDETVEMVFALRATPGGARPVIEAPVAP
jgi:SAM-dependent methyltransferase